MHCLVLKRDSFLSKYKLQSSTKMQKTRFLLHSNNIIESKTDDKRGLYYMQVLQSLFIFKN